jgi:hypothetical protein
VGFREAFGRSSLTLNVENLAGEGRAKRDGGGKGLEPHDPLKPTAIQGRGQLSAIFLFAEAAIFSSPPNIEGPNDPR